MPRTLQDLKDEAERRLAAGQLVDALKVFRLVLEGAPLDFNLRLEVADVLMGAKAAKAAASIYQAVAEHEIRSGHPLQAMVGIKLLEGAGVEVGPLIERLVAMYSADSEVLGRGVRPAPADYSAEVRDDLDLDYAINQRELFEAIAQMAAYTENIENYPKVVPPVAIFSTLDRESFGELFSLLRLRRHRSGESVITQGEQGDAIYFVARGEVKVIKTIAGTGGEKHDIQLARLGPGSLFGEMALVSADPRGASVVCDGQVDVLELTKAQVDELAGRLQNVAGAMARFTRERLIANLLATNPLFAPFDEAGRAQLLARFTGHEVPKGTIFLEQGKPGTGLYLILQGRAEVLKWDGGEYVKIADLGPGDLAGEISLIHEEAASATVRTTSEATLLFLARELFSPLVEAVPDLLAHFARLAQERLDDAEFKLMQNKVLDEDFIESLDDDDITDDDLVMI